MSPARLLAAAMLLLGAAALAQTPLSATPASPANPASPFDENALRAYVSQQVAGMGADNVTRFDVRLAVPDSAAALAPCRRTEPFLPAGARLWGRSSLGVRCVDGAGWTFMLPVTVSVWGRAVVAAAPVAAGTVLSAQDLKEQEIELSREAGQPVRDAQLLAGRTLLRNANPGQPLRADMVRVTAVVQAGDPVRLRILGKGYSVVAAGQAMGSAGDGQPVRVRTELGKILTGVAREGRQVDVAL